MKKLLIVFIMCFSVAFAKDYYVSVNYSLQSDDLQILDFVQVTINSKTDKRVTINIVKTLLPFTHMIEKTIVANKKNDKYEFAFVDGFGNQAFGYIKFLQIDLIEFFIDCQKFFDEGKDLARLY
ncbi:hypothetical protein HRQ91_00200 [Treponema parvum]|uniref:Uncharacterized protein n=1 Tax=Treponema parvum TaxID=138851 RepID=A0A975F2B6_9SPIR|nr:hypothetical protein [Treponema parvum]QTQ13000.1 hypothetical protein HRQ91_00200 [Treponema parvum]